MLHHPRTPVIRLGIGMRDLRTAHATRIRVNPGALVSATVLARGMAEPWAHSCNVAGERHRLEDHLRATAELAGKFGSALGAERLCYVAGLVHDVGKIVRPWQEYLLASEAGVRTRKVNHKTSGANLFARLASEPGRLLIEGHHSGIPNYKDVPADDAMDPDRDRAVEAAARLLLPELDEVLSAGSVIPDSWSRWARADPSALEMAVRLSHSALVDADFLDTAAHFNASPVHLAPPTDFASLHARFIEALTQELAGRRPSPVDSLRGVLLDDCLAAANQSQGVFRLPAPTGSGKTISAAAFALAHATHHGLKRVIVAVPFLSITEQNAAVYRRLIGNENVVEHHSGVDPRREDQNRTGSVRARYGVENWDAPFVVTTTVQLFESLFSNRPSRTRKLHRLANAVIVLDEVQAIPPRVLPIILDGLRILQHHFGTTVVLSSATQPTWDLVGPWREAEDLAVRDIVSDPARLYAGLRRSSVEWAQVDSLNAVADLMAAEPHVMTVVNTTANARDVALALRDRATDGVFHLSTRMYAGHRRAVLNEVRERVAAGLPVRLVSTQLVEAGVDLDFPVVLRALAPAENLSQARGRCNREGHLASGRFIVLESPELSTLDAYKVGIAKTRQHFEVPSVDLDAPDAMRRYYADLYATLDVDGLQEARDIQAARTRLRYQFVADEFRMIQDDATAVVVAEAPGAEAVLNDLVRHIEAGGAPSPDRFRRLQEFSVNIPTAMLPRVTDYVVDELPGILVWRGAYDGLTGVSLDRNPHDSVW